jgi:cell division protein FtsL
MRALKGRNFKDFMRLAPFVAPLIVTAFVYAWLYTRINITGLPINELRSRQSDLVKRNDSIRLRIEQLQAPARIESIARRKLGMVSPEKWQVVAVDEPVNPPESPPGILAAEESKFGGTQDILGSSETNTHSGSVSMQHPQSHGAGHSG